MKCTFPIEGVMREGVGQVPAEFLAQEVLDVTELHDLGKLPAVPKRVR